MQRKTALITLTVLAVMLGGAGLYLSQAKKEASSDVKSAATMDEIKSDRVGLVVDKDKSLRRLVLTEEDEEKGALWRLIQPADSIQEFGIDANFEQGDSLRKLTAYTRQSLRDSVVSNVNVQLPRQFPGFKEISQRNLSINGIDANETIFEYSSGKDKIKQRMVLIFKNSDTAIYIVAQTKSSNYEEINSKYFEPLIQSVKIE